MCNDYWGDDWNDRPYECNAGSVYDKFVRDYATIIFPFDYVVLTPEGDWHYRGNSPFCKYDFKARKAPCVVVCLSCFKSVNGPMTSKMNDIINNVISCCSNFTYFYHKFRST